jgi:hypothetical protein
MRLATITLPIADNDGNPLNDVHAALQLDLIAQFGGFTAIDARGGWRDKSTGKVYAEPVTQYQIECEDSDAGKLCDIAKFFGRMANQICMFVMMPTGNVGFIDTEFRVSAIA